MSGADVVLINGKVLCGDPRYPRWSEGLAIKFGKILAMGDKGYLKKFINKATIVYDLEGCTVLPGLIDSHFHILETAQDKVWLNLRDVDSIEKLKEKIKQALLEKKSGEWILGRGWDHERFLEKRYPTRYDIDEVSPNNPVLLIRVCGHIAIANTPALKLADIDHEEEGVHIDESGRPTGILKEKVLEKVFRVIPQPTIKDLLKLVEKTLREVASTGLTTLHAMSVTPIEFIVLQLLRLEGKLPIRIRVYLNHDLLAYLRKLGIMGSLGDDLLKICGIKVIADGVLGGRTAALNEPYSDDPDNRGMMLVSKDDLRTLMKEAMENRLQIAVHAIGDRCIETVLRIARGLHIKSTLLRIEHVSLTPPPILELLSRVKPIVVVQPHFIISDTWIVDRLGEYRARWTYAFKTLMKICSTVAGSSDSPVEPISPWKGMYAAIERGESEGLSLAHLSPEEKLDIGEALSLYTINGARACGDNSLGVIEEGKYADLVVIDTDPYELDVRDLIKIKVKATIVGGKIVHGKLSSVR